MTLHTTLSREAEVQKVLNTLRPAMEADGGGVELVEISDMGIIKVRFKGACLLCPSINLTLKFGLIQTLKQNLSWVTDVQKTN